MRDLAPDVPAMLARNGIAGPETAFAHNGYSGCRMSRVRSGDDAYVIKRTSFTDDWIIQMTSDHAVREARIAVSNVLASLRTVRSPSIDAAHDGDGFAILMRDVSPHLLASDRPLPPAVAGRMLAAAAEMHALYWDRPPADDVGWCGIRERMLMLSPAAGERMVSAGFADVGFVPGWRRFHAWAPPEVSALARRLHDDPAPLLAVLAAFPQTLLHNDIKAANCAIDREGLWLFDWALAGHGPVCVEIAWLMGVNVDLLPWSFAEAMDRYASLLREALNDPRAGSVRWDEQYDLARLLRLLLLGWAKLPRTSDGGAEVRWLCDGALAAAARYGL
jgi:hypothetical protein